MFVGSTFVWHCVMSAIYFSKGKGKHTISMQNLLRGTKPVTLDLEARILDW
jgi:hypothetical protein